MKRQAVKKKIFVGVSGGVDSSVSAALLKKEGHDVTGCFIKIWQPEWTGCSMKDDRLDAMRVCAKLDIPFKEIDLTDEYKRDVVDYMISEYRAGKTPNPDVMCNRYIKFGTFFDWALAEGADAIATGHYAQIKLIADSFQLIASRDEKKDQTYFLWTLTQGELSRVYFPVGGLRKSEVRKLAKRFGLPTAEKKDSQGLCFVGPVDIKDFLSRYVKQKRGDVLDEKGNTIGYHDGAWFLTIGERHGFTITHKTSADEPQYVLRKDMEHNTITVGPRGALRDKSHQVFLLPDANWIAGKPPKESEKFEAQVRYHGKRFPCHVRAGGTELEFLSAPDAPASGQSAVVYDGEVCLGGGILEREG